MAMAGEVLFLMMYTVSQKSGPPKYV